MRQPFCDFLCSLACQSTVSRLNRQRFTPDETCIYCGIYSQKQIYTIGPVHDALQQDLDDDFSVDIAYDYERRKIKNGRPSQIRPE